MDPVTMVAAAVAAGAAAGLTDTAKQAVAEAYQALKGVITRRHASVDVTVVEADPLAPARRAVLVDALTHSGAGEDSELLAAAGHLWDVVEQRAPRLPEVIGVRVSRSSSGELEISEVVSSGTAVVVEETSVEGKVKITGVRAGMVESPHPPSARQ